MIIESLKPYKGQHCETTTTGTLLNQLGIELSEPILFGIGEGLGYIFWNMKTMQFPFIGGRIKPDLLTQNIARNLNLRLTVKETASPQKAWNEVKGFIDKGQAVGLKLDCFYLEYFSTPFHFAGHYTALYGYDDMYAYLIDTLQQGSQVKTSLESLALARAAKGPMSSKHLYYTLSGESKGVHLKTALKTAIRNNANDYLNPPITNIGYKGVLKTSTEIVKWFTTSNNIEEEFKTTALLMEKAGTGGALFRNLYRDFLTESYHLLTLDPIKEGQEIFAEVAVLWKTVAELFEKVSVTKDRQYIEQASAILKTIAGKEKKAMEALAVI